MEQDTKTIYIEYSNHTSKVFYRCAVCDEGFDNSRDNKIICPKCRKAVMEMRKRLEKEKVSE